MRKQSISPTFKGKVGEMQNNLQRWSSKPMTGEENQNNGPELVFKILSPEKSRNLHASAECMLSRVQLFVTSWTVARQAPLSMGFSGQEYWRGFPFPPLGHLPDPEIGTESPVSPALAGGLFTTGPPGKP